jgi:predicted RND superfamily exporter protein
MRPMPRNTRCAIARRCSSRALRASAAWERLVGRIAAFSARRAAWILAFTALLSVIFAFGFAQLRVDASFEDLYGEDSRVVRWARFVGEHLRRPDSLEVELAAPPGARVEDSPTLAVVDDVAKSLAGVDGLGPVRSVADPISLVHQLVSGNDPFWYRLPARAADTREILDLLAERDPDALARWLDADALRFRVSVESGKPPQAEMRRIFAEVDALLAARLPPGWSASLTGPLAMVHEMVEEIQRTQLESFLIAGSVVLVLAAIFLGSARGALLAAVPTLLPVVVTLGAMGLTGASLDVGSAMVAAVVIGIAVDDAIHLLSHFQRRRASGQTPAAAMDAAVRHVARAVVTTSAALAIGFFTLTASSWKTISSFGALSAISIIGALAAALVVLPALVRATSKLRAGESPQNG